ncbi:hypothetical protein AMJ80_03085 [bacterium SM23_31]|nr:MAG: hypothetical protein AMJ80_03085 [bacterium SM23_31]
MRNLCKIITAILVAVFILIDSSYLFCLHSTEFNINSPAEDFIDKAHNGKESHESKKVNHDPFHHLHHYTLNTVDTSVNIESQSLK